MKISASPEYMKKEEVRKSLQSMLEDFITSGRIKDQKGLEEFWNTVELASVALKGIPYDVLSHMVTVKEVREIVSEILREEL